VANYFEDNDDLQYYFDKGIDWDPLVKATERGLIADGAPTSTVEAVEIYRDIANLIGRFAAEEIAPHAAAMDECGVSLADGEAVVPPQMTEIFEKIAELELHRMCIPRELGGMNCPMLMYFVNGELFGRADVSMMAHHGFHAGPAVAMLAFSIYEGSTTAAGGKLVETRFQAEIEEIASGRAWAAMDITEPDAGSDMAALRTVGEQGDDGQWTVTGQKIFITSGHGKFHFVIARTEKANGPQDPKAGLKGLSLFLVPTYDDANGVRRRIATIDRVEEKLGHHASATCSVTFDHAPAKLIGKRGEGFKYMLALMNNARLGVGFESIGLCEAAYRLARDYAATRSSMGKTIDRHEIIADYLDQMRTEIQGLRALAMHSAVHEELAQRYRMYLELQTDLPSKKRAYLERKTQRLADEARRTTPLVKYLAAEKAVEMARRGLQIHGGNGYMKDYGAEKLLRDALVMPIYEGTSQIQALMVMKDTLGGITRHPQQFVRTLAESRWRALSARGPHARRVAKLKNLALDVQQHLLRRVAVDAFRTLQDLPLGEWLRAVREWDPKRNFAHALLHAERLTELLAEVSIAQILLGQAQRHPERLEVLERYLERAEPRCRHLHDTITSTGSGLLQRLSVLADTEREAAE